MNFSNIISVNHWSVTNSLLSKADNKQQKIRENVTNCPFCMLLIYRFFRQFINLELKTFKVVFIY